MNSKLLIIGASGHGKVVADIALKMNKWNTIAFLDDDTSKKSLLGIEVIGNSGQVNNFIKDYDIFVGIGNNETRKKIIEKLENSGASIPTLIHPNAVIGKDVVIEYGTIVMAGVIINSSTRIRKGSIINTGVTIDHDNILEEFVHISPGSHLAGSVTIGKGTWLGIGSIISNNISIAPRSIIGAGAVVIQNIVESGTYIGVPAKKINRNSRN